MFVHTRLKNRFGIASLLERSGQLSKATIVFSPRTRSFEKFDNEINRGRMFKDVVKKELIK